jgi:hypothetical protein
MSRKRKKLLEMENTKHRGRKRKFIRSKGEEIRI